MSRRCRSTRRRWQLLAEQVGQHVAGGGLVLAATHIPLGLASERRLGDRRAECRRMSGFWTLLKRDLLLQVREGGAVGTALGFYLVVVAMMPLGLGPDLNLLSRIAPGVLWIALLLAALLSLPRIFEADDEDGSLEVIATGDLPLELATAAKALAHWISTGIPLALLAPVLGLLLEPGARALIRCWWRPCWRGRRRSASSARSARR